MTSTPPRHAFTLIELLVVVTIIAIIAMMLLSAIRLVREAATKATCMARLRQVHVGLLSYSADNKGMFPPISTTWHAQYGWGLGGTYQGFRFLMPEYIDTEYMLGLPTNTNLFCPSFDKQFVGLFTFSYGYAYNGNRRSGSSTGAWDPAWAPNATQMAYAAGPARLVDGQRGLSSSNIVLVYERVEDSTSPYWWEPALHPHPRDTTRGAATTLYGGNVLFVDGHVSWQDGDKWSRWSNGYITRYIPVRAAN